MNPLSLQNLEAYRALTRIPFHCGRQAHRGFDPLTEALIWTCPECHRSVGARRTARTTPLRLKDLQRRAQALAVGALLFTSMSGCIDALDYQEGATGEAVGRIQETSRITTCGEWGWKFYMDAAPGWDDPRNSSSLIRKYLSRETPPVMQLVKISYIEHDNTGFDVGHCEGRMVLTITPQTQGGPP